MGGTVGERGGHRRLLGGVGAALATVAVAAVGFAAPAGAAVHSITVTPSTGLSDGQVVQVTGSGFTETPLVNDWAVSECRADVLNAPITLLNALGSCDVATPPFVFVHADAQGNFSMAFTLHQTITVGTSPVDCSVTPCAILVAQITSSSLGFDGAGAPISFGPPPPSAAALHANGSSGTGARGPLSPPSSSAPPPARSPPVTRGTAGGAPVRTSRRAGWRTVRRSAV